MAFVLMFAAGLQVILTISVFHFRTLDNVQNPEGL
jgi:hypothetical protein